jgi:hypothetical protein
MPLAHLRQEAARCTLDIDCFFCENIVRAELLPPGNPLEKYLAGRDEIITHLPHFKCSHHTRDVP